MVYQRLPLKLKKNNVTILVATNEPNAPKLETSKDFLEFMKEIYSHSVGLNFDIGHFFCVGEDPAELVYRLARLHWPYSFGSIGINRIHNHLIPGEGAINLRAVLKAISDIGYDSFITSSLSVSARPDLCCKRSIQLS